MKGSPLFIVFEGIDGSGKTSQIARLANYIRAKDKYQDVLLTREPTWRATELKEKLQGDGDAFSDGEHMAYLFVQDRKAHSDEQIVPALRQNTFVLCDRYAMSTCAYQGAQGVALDTLVRYHEAAGTLTPHLTLYFNVSREVAEKRMTKRGETRERFEKNQVFTEKLIEQYHSLALDSVASARVRSVIGEVYRIDGNGPIDAVEAEVKKAFDCVYESTRATER